MFAALLFFLFSSTRIKKGWNLLIKMVRTYFKKNKELFTILTKY